MTAPEWVECADPNKLAAAVAAGVRVERSDDDGASWWPTTYRTAENFRHAIAYGTRFRLPRSVSWRLDGEPTTDDPFPIGSRVVDEDGDEATVIGVHGVWRWLLSDSANLWADEVCHLSPAPAPTVPVPADVVDRILATGQVSDDDRAALVRAGEGE